mmetsp:Transcript_87241/g.154547  ORF Transcript_87241/g.154547 Transcript_87241/m.154547 type:complete len:201 (+) Transcript_87241:1189-1791(+)
MLILCPKCCFEICHGSITCFLMFLAPALQILPPKPGDAQTHNKHNHHKNCNRYHECSIGSDPDLTGLARPFIVAFTNTFHRTQPVPVAFPSIAIDLLSNAPAKRPHGHGECHLAISSWPNCSIVEEFQRARIICMKWQRHLLNVWHERNLSIGVEVDLSIELRCIHHPHLLSDCIRIERVSRFDCSCQCRQSCKLSCAKV